MGVHVGLSDIIKAEQGLKKVLNNVPLMKDTVLSEKYECNVYLKREDLQIVRSFKIRGAYNKMHSLNEEELAFTKAAEEQYEAVSHDLRQRRMRRR